uniref:Polyprenyl synthetase n=1 Tax=viral metagenome TaxID=1070528 RepID=A0A6C0HLP7_9ZZZZ
MATYTPQDKQLNTQLNTTLQDLISIFNIYISSTEFLNKNYPDTIHSRITYLFGVGKRMRPCLHMVFANFNIYGYIDNVEYTNILNTAVFIETIHCLSLIIDDLPEMDNDVMRRDLQSFHKKWGHYQTDMFIFYILNKLVSGIDCLFIKDKFTSQTTSQTTSQLNILKKIKNLVARCLAMLVDGQYIDLMMVDNLFTDKCDNLTLTPIESTFAIEFATEINIIFSCLENVNLTPIIINQIEINIELNSKKTGALFNLAILSGLYWQINKFKLYELHEPNSVNNLEGYGFITLKEFIEIVDVWSFILGYLFQISDDILDVIKDEITGSPNLCLIIGICNCINLIGKLSEWLKNGAYRIQQYASLLHPDMYIDISIIIEIIEKITKRNT